MKIYFIAIVVCIALLCVQAADAGIIKTYTWSGGGGVNQIRYTGGHTFFSLYFSSDRAGTEIFNSYMLGDNESDITVWVTAANDPQFQNFVTLLTNGERNSVSFFMRNAEDDAVITGLGTQDYWSLGFSTTDLAGYDVKAISATFNVWNVAVPGHDWNRNGIWTDYKVNVTVTAWDTLPPVPEPGLLMVAGCFCLLARKKYR